MGHSGTILQQWVVLFARSFVTLLNANLCQRSGFAFVGEFGSERSNRVVARVAGIPTRTEIATGNILWLAPMM